MRIRSPQWEESLQIKGLQEPWSDLVRFRRSLVMLVPAASKAYLDQPLARRWTAARRFLTGLIHDKSTVSPLQRRQQCIHGLVPGELDG